MDSFIKAVKEQMIKQAPVKKSEIDEELEKLVQEKLIKIKVVGCGGSGCNTINRIAELGIEGAELIAVNTDAQDLLYTNADKKVLIGKNTTKGLGAGSNPKVGEQAAKEQIEEIKEAIKEADLVFLTAGLGGGTGSGSLPVIAELLSKENVLTISFVTLPFKMEGKHRWQNAIEALAKLEGNVDTLIIIPNDKLLELAPNLPINLAFKVADELLANAIKNLTEVINKTGLVNIDFADVRAIMKDGEIGLIGFGESDGQDRAKEVVNKALNNPLIDADPKEAKKALVHILGGNDFKLQEADEILKNIQEALDEDAKLIWGAHLNPELQGNLRVMIILTGLKPKYLKEDDLYVQKTKELKGNKDKNLGIDVLE
jgi:cell division protein FtsZ